MVSKTTRVSPDGPGESAQKRAALQSMKNVALLAIQWTADLALHAQCPKTGKSADSCDDCITGRCGTEFNGFEDLANITAPHIPQIPDMLGKVSDALLCVWSQHTRTAS